MFLMFQKRAIYLIDTNLAKSNIFQMNRCYVQGAIHIFTFTVNE